MPRKVVISESYGIWADEAVSDKSSDIFRFAKLKRNDDIIITQAINLGSMTGKRCYLWIRGGSLFDPSLLTNLAKLPNRDQLTEVAEVLELQPALGSRRLISWDFTVCLADEGML